VSLKETTMVCSSHLITGDSGVTVMCTYNVTIYAGYSVCLLNQMELSPSKCISSNVSGSMIEINGTVNGEHEVFINPIWTAPLPMGIFQSPLTETYSLTGIPVTSVSTTSKFSEE